MASAATIIHVAVNVLIALLLRLVGTEVANRGRCADRLPTPSESCTCHASTKSDADLSMSERRPPKKTDRRNRSTVLCFGRKKCRTSSLTVFLVAPSEDRDGQGRAGAGAEHRAADRTAARELQFGVRAKKAARIF
jgi:hypothetical protein